MAARKAICFGEPAQLSGSVFWRAGIYFTPALHPLSRYACLLGASRFSSQGQGPRP
jgi:hypothetical protein